MDDLIKRQDAQMAVQDHYNKDHGFRSYEDGQRMLNRINALPLVQKTGKWIKDEEQSREHTEPIFVCSCCQNNSAWGTEERTRYCSFCGARMENES